MDVHGKSGSLNVGRCIVLVFALPRSSIPPCVLGAVLLVCVVHARVVPVRLRVLSNSPSVSPRA